MSSPLFLFSLCSCDCPQIDLLINYFCPVQNTYLLAYPELTDLMWRSLRLFEDLPVFQIYIGVSQKNSRMWKVVSWRCSSLIWYRWQKSKYLNQHRLLHPDWYYSHKKMQCKLLSIFLNQTKLWKIIIISDFWLC